VRADRRGDGADRVGRAPAIHSIGDVDPELANRTRERLWRELEGEDVSGAGAHFPELKFGRVLQGSGKRWWT
jgi:hypothetical protein